MEKENKESKKISKKANTPMKVVVEDTKSTINSTLALITSSLTLVAGLAWNSVFTQIFDTYLKKKLSEFGQVLGLLLYAIILTIIVVLVVTRLKKLQSKIGGKSIK